MMKFKEVKTQKIVRLTAGVLAAVLIFFLGLGIGDGRISFHNSNGQHNNLPAQLNFSLVNEVYNDLKNQYDGSLSLSQISDGLNAGLANSTGDPYTEYFNPSQAKDLNNELHGTINGIGAELSADSHGNIEVVSPIAGTPAAKAGLQPHDIIAAINGQSTQGMAVDIAVSKIRGPVGTKVTLTIVRGQNQFKLTITRANITVPSVNYKVINGNIGYMQISQFTDDTSSLAQKAAQSFAVAHVKGVILDLRGNPGGEVDAAVNVSSLWLPTGKTIMQEKTGGTVVQTYVSTGNDILKGLPTVVLIDGGSASASEITAGALKDNGAARLIGTTSFGKGSVQQIDTLSNGGELKVTIAHWFRPNGQNINHKGITPDQTVNVSQAQIQAGQDPQKQAAISWIEQQ